MQFDNSFQPVLGRDAPGGPDRVGDKGTRAVGIRPIKADLVNVFMCSLDRLLLEILAGWDGGALTNRMIPPAALNRVSTCTNG